MKLITVVAASFLAMAACSKKEDTRSKPVACPKAGEMVAKRLGEFAEKVDYTPAQRTKLDKDMAAAISTRCTEDQWDEVALGCLGAVASVKEGKLDEKTYRGAVDTCVKAIGDEKWKKMEDTVGVIVRASKSS